jgi:hypothetical protein
MCSSLSADMARTHCSLGSSEAGLLSRNVLCAVLTLLLFYSSVRAAVAADPPVLESPSRHRVGLYITDLNSFDLLRGTFGATLWVWSIGPAAPRTLQTMEFVNAEAVSVQLESTVPRGSMVWSQRKVAGTFRHQWDLRNFPFDRQALEILLEEGAEEEHSFVYETDTANSGYRLQDAIEGWRVRDMRFEAENADYATSFGDPAAPGPHSRFSRLRVVLSLERSDYSGFFKLTAALYAGFLICAIGCLMHVTATTFAPRITILGISLFAIVLNMRAASQALGSEHVITLVDKLHISGLAYIVLVTAVTLLVRVRSEWQTESVALIRLDNRCCLAAAFLFMIFNLLLLGQGTGFTHKLGP